MQLRPGDEDTDEVVTLEDLSLKSLIALVQRLKDTETSEQFLFREQELDQAFFWADESLKHIRSHKNSREDLDQVTLIRELVMNAHDFVGTSNIHAAIAELNKVIDLKMGL